MEQHRHTAFDRSLKKCSAEKGREAQTSKRSNEMNASIKAVVKLIEKHTNEKITTKDLTEKSSAPMQSAIEAVLKQIEARAGDSAPIRQMAEQVRKAIQ
jgi:archaellum component FlaC